jgi:site-specific recombinase XerD
LNLQFDVSVTAKSCLTQQIENYIQSLHRVSEETKSHYKALLNQFVDYLVGKGINTFEYVSKTEIGQFLSTKKASNTRNLYIFLIKSFYSNYLGKGNLVQQLHRKPEEETITPAELLTPTEVIALANDAG